MSYNRLVLHAMLAILMLPASSSFAKGKRKADAPQDQIQILAHVPLAGGHVERLLVTRHYRRDYLYAQYESAKTVTLMDVTDAAHPVVLSNVSLPSTSPAGNALVTVAGNAALVMDGAVPSEAFHPERTIHILSFADPAHPAVEQEFQNVSTITADDVRGLIFLATANDLWILQQHLAKDPAEEAQWEHDVLGAR